MTRDDPADSSTSMGRTASPISAASDPPINAIEHQLIVNDVPMQCFGEEFEAIFAQIGTLRDARLVMSRRGVKHRGFGFVSYADPKDAQRALRLLNGFEMYGAVLRVSVSTRQSLSTEGELNVSTGTN